MQQSTGSGFRQRPARALRVLRYAALACIAMSAIPARAQWQEVFGVPTTNEAGRAVAQVSDGGYIAVGSANDDNTGTMHAYVVRRDANGGAVWDRRYHIGQPVFSNFNDVKVCANGDYVVVGQAGSAQPGTRHLLAMRLDQNGNIIWSRTFGDNVRIFYGASVVEALSGNGTTTQTGDIIIGGSGNDYPNSTSLPFLMRLTAQGNLIWHKVYDPGAPYTDTHIFSITETRVSPGAGDIVATGQGAGMNFDLMVLRVDGNSGAFISSPHGMAMFDIGMNDHGRSIIELQNGTYAGDLVIAGISSSMPWLGFGAVLMVELPPDPCDAAGPRAASMLGDTYGNLHFGECVREITDPALGTPGDVVVGGMTHHTPGGVARAFLQQYAAGSMANIGTFNRYGIAGANHCYGIAECTSALGAPGFVLAGVTNAQAPLLDNNDLWLVRTDASMISCNYDAENMQQDRPTLDRTCLTITPAELELRIICGIQSLLTDWGNEFCIEDIQQKNARPAPSPEIASGNTLLPPNPSPATTATR